MRKIIITAIVALALTGCTSTYTTESPIEPVENRSANFVVVTDWAVIPANNEYATDIYVRLVKIENVCYTQTASVKDWQYTFTPHTREC
jgi:hypothetical protein